MLLAQMAARQVNHPGGGLLMLAEAAEQVEVAQAELVRIASAFQQAPALLRAPATPSRTRTEASAMEELTEEMSLATPYARANPDAPPPSPLADRPIKSEPIDEGEDFDWRRTSFLDGLFGGPAPKSEPTTPTPTIKQEPVTPPARTSMDEAFDEMDRAINQVRPSREGSSRTTYPGGEPQAAVRAPPAPAPFGKPNPNSSSPVVLLYLRVYIRPF